MPGKFGSQGTALPKHWGFPAAVEHSSPGAQESCQLLQPPQQVPAEGLNMEPHVSQDWLCQLGRSALRASPVLPSVFLLGVVQVSWIERK